MSFLRLPRRALAPVAGGVLAAALLLSGCFAVAPGSMPCPVTGTVSFRDDFGEPRTGHTHKGVDIFAPRNRPDVAVAEGDVHQLYDSTGGGNTVWLTTADNTLYVYMHLDHFAGGERHVEAGDVIGYVGATGNATGYHTHFEIHPNNGPAVNPYATLVASCPYRS